MFPNSPNIRLTLLSINSVLDSIGNKSLVLIHSKEVIGINFSITSKEHYESIKQDIRIDMAVKINSFLYDGSKFADVGGSIYKIERTYTSGQFIEIYLSESMIKRSNIIGYS